MAAAVSGCAAGRGGRGSGRGVDVSDVQVMDTRDGGKFCFFTDPDGNNWAVQEIRNYVGAPLDEPAGG